MTATVKAGLIAALAALLFGLGWTANGWRLGQQIEATRAIQAQALATANASVLSAQKALDADRDTKAEAGRVIEQTQLAKLKVAKDETTSLRRCIADGTCGLRVNTTARAAKCPSNVPSTPDASSVDSGAGSTLTADAEQAYFELRNGIASSAAKLAACQETLKVNTSPAQR